MKRYRTLLALPLTASLLAASVGTAAAADKPTATDLVDLWGDALDAGNLPELPALPTLEDLTKMVDLPALPPPPSVEDIQKAFDTAKASMGNGMGLAGTTTAWINNPDVNNATSVISTALAGIPDLGQRDYAQEIWQTAFAGLNAAQQKMALAQGAADIAARQFGEYSPQALSAMRQITVLTLQLAAQAVSETPSTERDEAEAVFTRSGAREIGNASVGDAVDESKRQALNDARKEEREASRAADSDNSSGSDTSSSSGSSSPTSTTGSGGDSGGNSGGTTPTPSRTETITEQNDNDVLGDANLANPRDISGAEWEELKTTLQDLVDDKAGDNNVGIAAAPAGEGVGISAGAAGEKIYPASTIKIPIGMAVLSDLDLDDKVTVKDSDLTDGTGDLTAGEYTVSDLLEKMITISDNSATNVLINELGGETDGFKKINEIIGKADGNGVKIDNMMMADDDTSTVTANGMTNILKHLWAAAEGTESDILTADKAKTLLTAMGNQENVTKLPSKIDIPDDGSAFILNKTGEKGDLSHDVGYIIRDGKAVAVTVTTDLGTEAGADFIGDTGKAIYDWIGEIADVEGPSAGAAAGGSEESATSSSAAAPTTEDSTPQTAGTTTAAPQSAGTPTSEPDANSGNGEEAQNEEVTEAQQKAADEYDDAASDFLTANKKVLTAVEEFVSVARGFTKNKKTRDEREEAFEAVKGAQDDETEKWETMKTKEQAARQAGFTEEELRSWSSETSGQMVIKRDLDIDTPENGSNFNNDNEVQDAWQREADKDK